MRDMLYLTERTHRKMPEQVNSVVYFCVILFKTHQRDTVTEQEFDIILQLLAKVTNINNYL